MISAISWVPEGATKYIPEIADPPFKEEIDELVKSGALSRSGGNDEEDEEMEVDELLKARVVAEAMNQEGKSVGSLMDISQRLKELDMDNYDDKELEGKLLE